MVYKCFSLQICVKVSNAIIMSTKIWEKRERVPVRDISAAKKNENFKYSESVFNEKSLFLITLVRCKKRRFCLFLTQSFCMTSETWNIMHGFYSLLLGYFYGAFFVILVVHFHSHALYEKRAAWTFLEISPFVFYGRTLYGFGVNGDRLCNFGG